MTILKQEHLKIWWWLKHCCCTMLNEWLLLFYSDGLHFPTAADGKVCIISLKNFWAPSDLCPNCKKGWPICTVLRPKNTLCNLSQLSQSWSQCMIRIFMKRCFLKMKGLDLNCTRNYFHLASSFLQDSQLTLVSLSNLSQYTSRSGKLLSPHGPITQTWAKKKLTKIVAFEKISFTARPLSMGPK